MWIQPCVLGKFRVSCSVTHVCCSILTSLATFRRIIDDELTKRVPLDKLVQSKIQDSSILRDSLQESENTWTHSEENIFNFLQARVRLLLPKPGIDTPVPEQPEYHFAFQENLADPLNMALARLKPFMPSDSLLPATLKQYGTDLLRVIAHQFSYRRIGLFEDDNGNLCVQNNGNSSYAEFSTAGQAWILTCRLLAAAGAVGNIPAFDASSKPHYILVAGYDEFFTSSLVAATINDNVDMVQRHLTRLDIGTRDDGPQGSILHRLCFEFRDALKIALSRSQVKCGKVLIDYMAKHYRAWRIAVATNKRMMSRSYVGFEYIPISIILQIPMMQGCIELFEYVHERLPELQFRDDYVGHFAEGFTKACKMGHAEFVRHVIRTGGAELFKDKGKYKAIPKVRYTRYAHEWTDEDVDHPALAAAVYNRISVLKVLFAEKAWDIRCPGLLSAAVLGLGGRVGCPPDSYEKSGSRYMVKNFLFESGLEISRSTIRVINRYAKYLHTRAPKSITGDAAMTFLLLVAAIKTKYTRKQLRTRLLVSVKKVLQLIVELQPGMRYDYARKADVSLGWILT